MKRTGVVINWNEEKGYGFVRDSKTSEEIFFHISEIEQKWLRPKPGHQLSYHIATDGKGKKQANSINITDLKLTETGGGKALIFLLLYFCLGWFGVYLGKLPVIILYAYLIMSAIAFFYYWLDKKLAKANRKRVPETTLHLLGVLFGWPGANLAQQFFRHKTVKKEFRLNYYLSVFFNIAFIAYVMHPKGEWLHKLLTEWSVVFNHTLFLN